MVKTKFDHNNFNVSDLEKSLKFYKENLGLHEEYRKDFPEFTLVFLKDAFFTNHSLELTWLKNRKQPYNLGDNEFHLCVRVEDYEHAYKTHKKNDVICFENPEMNLYFIEDPDGYWIEIIGMDRS